MIKVAQYIINFMLEHGVTDTFLVTGGGAMHIDDALAHTPEMHCTFNHHEQACAIAAEGYARLTGKIALVSVTSGPGGTNALTGVMGGYLDSIPMFVVSGQVKRETTCYTSNVPLRQLGDQEFDIVESIHNMTKFAAVVMDPTKIAYYLEKAWFLANSGRKGPVWLDITLDVQASLIDETKLAHFTPSNKDRSYPLYDGKYNGSILDRISKAKKPVILIGEGIRMADCEKEMLSFIEKVKVPVVTAWNAHDELWDTHPLYCGRPGTVGTRGGNFVVQDSDLLLVLGCRLNIRQISYNYSCFAKNAYKIMVDVDENELKKKTISIDLPIWANLKDFFNSILNDKKFIAFSSDHSKWLSFARKLNEKYPACLPSYLSKSKPMNPYAFVKKLFEFLPEDETIVTGNGAACVQTFQAAEIKKGQRLFTNSGCAAMGYGFPAAIGACVAKKGERVICIDGDGSFQMNLQELQTVIYNHLNLKIIYFNNNGYLSIEQTQHNLFKPPFFGCIPGSGISFPDMSKVIPAYGISYFVIDNLKQINTVLAKSFAIDGPAFIEAKVDSSQNFEPKLSSKVLPNGTIVSPEIDDMYPFLNKEEYLKNKI